MTTALQLQFSSTITARHHEKFGGNLSAAFKVLIEKQLAPILS